MASVDIFPLLHMLPLFKTRRESTEAAQKEKTNRKSNGGRKMRNIYACRIILIHVGGLWHQSSTSNSISTMNSVRLKAYIRFQLWHAARCLFFSANICLNANSRRIWFEKRMKYIHNIFIENREGDRKRANHQEWNKESQLLYWFTGPNGREIKRNAKALFGTTTLSFSEN